MKGDILRTKYFGTYTEERDTTVPVTEITGRVQLKQYMPDTPAYLWSTDTGVAIRYDLPAFMKKYQGCKVAILGRQYQKQVGEKVYNKLVVVGTRVLELPQDKKFSNFSN